MLALIGGFLVAEGFLSIVGSQDQRSTCTVGRLLRIGAGAYLLTR